MLQPVAFTAKVREERLIPHALDCDGHGLRVAFSLRACVCSIIIHQHTSSTPPSLFYSIQFFHHPPPPTPFHHQHQHATCTLSTIPLSHHRLDIDPVTELAGWFVSGQPRKEVRSRVTQLMSCGAEGTFLIRDKQDEPDCYALVRKKRVSLANNNAFNQYIPRTHAHMHACTQTHTHTTYIHYTC